MKPILLSDWDPGNMKLWLENRKGKALEVRGI